MSLAEFVSEILELVNKETEQSTLWDMYLNSAWLEKSFAEFKESIIYDNSSANESIDFETTVKESKGILKNFTPNE